MMLRLIGLVTVAATISGCEAPKHAPLIFGQTQTLGVSIATAANGTAPEVTLGYRDANIAMVPTTIEQPGGENTQLEATVGGGEKLAADGETVVERQKPAKDAFSTFGQFSAAVTGATAKTALGKFFATGLAAQKISDGFSCALSEGTSAACTGKGTAANAGRQRPAGG